MWAIVRNIVCKKCGLRGMAEDQGADDCPVRRIFKFQGKNSRGHLLFRCPSCNTVSTYAPYKFFHPAIKSTFFVIIVLVIVALLKWVSRKAF
jgi:hypothetical protein